MGIFDKKSKGRAAEDFDSPIEKIDLDSMAAAPISGSGGASDENATLSEQAAEPVAAQPSEPEPEPEVEPEPPKKSQNYGIEEAIALMRTLPAENVELVVRVVKHTLESTNIDIPLIIDDATAKQKRIGDRIAVLKEEISSLEQEIAKRTDEISALEEDNEETSMVKERLELAEKLGKGTGKTDAKPRSGATAKAPTGRSTRPSQNPPAASRNGRASASPPLAAEKSGGTLSSKK